MTEEDEIIIKNFDQEENITFEGNEEDVKQEIRSLLQEIHQLQ